jgi:hypothetical protein
MLSPRAEQVIKNYLNLPFSDISGVRCPYFNNARLAQRGQLRVLTGKGSPEEIVEETKIISLQYHAGLFDKEGHCCLHDEHPGASTIPDDIRKFLIDHNLGIECSGFVTHVLREHFKQTKQIDITKKFSITSPKNILRWLISKLRPIENMSVKIYTDDKNTTKVAAPDIGYNYQKIEPGDVITILETGPAKKRNHIILITNTENDVIHYVHARAWSSEGKYGHGVTEGNFKIINPQADLTNQQWTEKEKTGNENETYQEIKDARLVEIRRIKT